MTGAVAAGRAFLRRLGQGFGLAFWRRPRSQVQLVGFGVFLGCCALALALYAIQDYFNTEPPAHFVGRGFHRHASYFLAVLAGAWVAARVLHRPALWLTLATLAVLVGIPWTAISVQVYFWLGGDDSLQHDAWRILLAMAGLLALLRAVGYLAGGTPLARRIGATLALTAVLAWPWYWQQTAWFWYPPQKEETAEAAPTEAPVAPKKRPGFDPERLMYSQSRLVAAAVADVKPQTPGSIDLFAIGFAGDAEERAFGNEVAYFRKLMALRFGAAERTVGLVNSPRSLDELPLATLTNLRETLSGVAARMDTGEDVLVLFLTSHGSEDHRLFVGMEPLPLRQIRPRHLRRALDDAGIQWRVVVVSACFSGGFVDALRGPRTLVITAARADRPSFGCGTDSQLTWFGKAFLTQALNETTDFERAFSLASRQVREWELAEGETPSVPQMAGGQAIRKHLARWRETLPPAAPVPFEPAATPAQGAASSSR